MREFRLVPGCTTQPLTKTTRGAESVGSTVGVRVCDAKDDDDPVISCDPGLPRDRTEADRTL